MRFDNVAIVGMGVADGPHRLTSAELCQPFAATLSRLGASTGLLELLTGIKARRLFDPGVQPSTVAALAGAAALTHAHIEKERIGVVVSTSVCKDFIEPSVASIVHHKLGLGADCLNFDLGNACLAFLDGMSVVGNLIERGVVDYGLVVDGEHSREVVEATSARLRSESCDDATLRENLATLTLGSGGVAYVLGRADRHPEGHRFLGGVSMAATQHHELCRGQKEHMRTDGNGLLTAGLELARRTFLKAQATLGWTADRFAHLALHQVSAVHTNKLCELLGLDRKRAFVLYDEFGNIGPASLPTALAKMAAEGRIARGEKVGLLGIGSGLNCTMMEVVW